MGEEQWRIKVEGFRGPSNGSIPQRRPMEIQIYLFVFYYFFTSIHLEGSKVGDGELGHC